MPVGRGFSPEIWNERTRKKNLDLDVDLDFVLEMVLDLIFSPRKIF